MWRRLLVASAIVGLSSFGTATESRAAITPNPPGTICIDNKCVSTHPPTSGGAIKWNPGHYMASEGILKPGKTLADVVNELDDLNGWDQILGYRLFVNWATLEPTEGNYDFSVLDTIFTRLKTHYNKPKRLVLVVLPGTFASSMGRNDGGSIPLYIQRDPKYGPSPVAGSYGWWGHNSGGASTGSYVAALFRPAVQARFTALIQAIGAHYDADPYFEAFIFQEDSWMVGTWKGAPDFAPSSDAPFPALLSAAVAAFPHTNVAMQNTWLIQEPPTLDLANWMFTNRVLEGSADTVGQTAFDKYNFASQLAWGLQAYCGTATSSNAAVTDQRITTHAMMDVESAEMTGPYFTRLGGPFTPLDLVTALNQTFKASHAFWTHFSGAEYGGTVPAASKWSNLAATLSAHPLLATSYPSIYPH
ncbi:MAG TPA: hypothetical protein VIY90_14680 [Steroidobacteraceae bacterium]